MMFSSIVLYGSSTRPAVRQPDHIAGIMVVDGAFVSVIKKWRERVSGNRSIVLIGPS